MQGRVKYTHTIKDIKQRAKLKAVRTILGKMAIRQNGLLRLKNDPRFDKDDWDSDQLIITPCNYLT
jgi:hypothetical protein